MSEISNKCRTIIVLYLLFQSTALSAEFAGGTGEPNDPYQIATAEQLISIGSEPDLLEKSFVLVADIDLDPNLPGGRIFKDALIAQDEGDSVSGHRGSSFNGFLDGQGHTIANLHIEGKYGYDAGLFGQFNGLVKDLHLTDVVVSGSPCGAIAGSNMGMMLSCSVTGQVSGVEDVGGLVGTNGGGRLMKCKAHVLVIGDSKVGGMVGGGPSGTLMSCQVKAEVRGNSDVGGLVGSQHNNLIIECRVTGVVNGRSNVGGLIGNFYDMLILRSSADCAVTAEQTAGGLIGGSAGWDYDALIMDCCFRGSIAGFIVGGLMGEAHNILVINCYSACEVFPNEGENREVLIGGLFGDILAIHWAPKTIGCFWDAELSSMTASIGSEPSLELGKGLTTEQMMNENMFGSAGWDLNHVWMISEGEYPKLRWEVIGDEAVATP